MLRVIPLALMVVVCGAASTASAQLSFTMKLLTNYTSGDPDDPVSHVDNARLGWSMQVSNTVGHVAGAEFIAVIGSPGVATSEDFPPPPAWGIRLMYLVAFCSCPLTRRRRSGPSSW